MDVAVLLLAVLYEGDSGGGLLNVRHPLQDESLCLCLSPLLTLVNGGVHPVVDVPPLPHPHGVV